MLTARLSRFITVGGLPSAVRYELAVALEFRQIRHGCAETTQ